MNNVTSHILIFFGLKDKDKHNKLPNHLQPTHPRNDALDIYKNNIEATFSYQEIGEYYESKRALKNKPFLPTEQVTPHKFFKSTSLTKREVLEKSQDPDHQKTKISFVSTKAKIHDIQHTLHLRHKYKHEQTHRLQSELQQAHQHYVIGKPG